METFPMLVEISGLDRERYETVDALVGTNATYTMLPASTLRALGIPPFDWREFKFADGERIHMNIGLARVRIDGRVRTTIVVFADEGSRPVLGRVTLEEFSLAPDSVNRRLVRVPAIGIRA